MLHETLHHYFQREEKGIAVELKDARLRSMTANATAILGLRSIGLAELRLNIGAGMSECF